MDDHAWELWIALGVAIVCLILAIWLWKKTKVREWIPYSSLRDDLGDIDWPSSDHDDCSGDDSGSCDGD